MDAAAPHRVVLTGTAAAAALLVVAAPAPATALRRLSQASSALDSTEPLLALISLLAWALAVWLLLVVTVTAGAHLPGAAGHGLAAVARRTAPAAVRRGVEVALGLSVAAGVLTASPASAAPGSAPGLDWAAAPVGVSAAAPPLDWTSPATEGTTTRAQDLDWAATPPADPQPTEVAAPVPVVVRPGDSLWRLAERDLARSRGDEPTAAEVAQAWPSWWAANRDAVGDDPDLLLPGIPLTPPSADAPPSPDAPSAS